MRYLILIMLLLLLLSPAAAQEESPLPILNAEEIFAEGVTVLERLPVLEMDWQSQQIKYYNPDTDEWELYDFPRNVVLRASQERSDGTYLVFEGGEAPSHNYYAGDGHVWIFDPQAGTIEQPEPICNLVHALPNEGQWYFTKIDDNYHLCNNETGQLSPRLSTDFDECILSQWNRFIGISPDKTWIIFRNCYDDEQYFAAYAFFVFAYNTETNEIYALGLTDYSQGAFVIEWFDDNTAILSMHSYGFDGLNDLSLRGNIPEFVEAKYILYEIKLGDTPSMQRLFDINANAIHQYNNQILWLEADTVPHPIYSYDFSSQKTDLVTSLEECAYLAQCRVVWNNDNTLGIKAIAEESPPFTPMYIYDKRTDTWVIEGEYTIILIVQDERVFVYSYSPETYLESIDLNTFEVTTYGKVSTSIYETIYPVSPDERSIIVRDWNNEIALGIYDIELNTAYPILVNSAYEYENILYESIWDDENTLLIRANFYPNVYSGRRFTIAHWHIRIDALSEEQS